MLTLSSTIRWSRGRGSNSKPRTKPQETMKLRWWTKTFVLLWSMDCPPLGVGVWVLIDWQCFSLTLPTSRCVIQSLQSPHMHLLSLSLFLSIMHTHTHIHHCLPTPPPTHTHTLQEVLFFPAMKPIDTGKSCPDNTAADKD